ncbi:MAG: hypothetical protein P4L41_13410 [Flavipsychrobacter sp.]|nr:hypothetical protein [Flavipsychrobacter sp.]
MSIANILQMDAIPDIINTPVIPASANIFWDDYNEPAQQRPLLVVSAQLNQDSNELRQLTKMLQACKLGTEDYNLITLIDGQKIAWHKLRDTYSPRAVLMLGIMPDMLGMTVLLRINEPNHFAGCIFIPTLSITDLETKTEMKRQLWNTALKPVFVDDLYNYQETKQ